MKEIRCTTANCEYHFRNRCLAENVDVDDKGVCITKQKREGGAYAQAVAEFEIAEELEPKDFNENEITCTCTECDYNCDCKCFSGDVLIGDSFFKTKCFSKRK